MDNPRGRVLSLVPDGRNVRAVVAVTDMPVCPRCAAGSGCGAGLLVRREGERAIEALVAPGLEPGVDDEVELRMQPTDLLRAAFLVYGLPLLSAVGAALCAYLMSLGDAGAVWLTLLGLGVGLAISRWRATRTTCLKRYTPRIERLC